LGNRRLRRAVCHLYAIHKYASHYFHSYVLELIKMKETFIDPLLHPFAATPLASMQEEETWRIESPAESIDHLPIASRFLGSSLRTETPVLLPMRLCLRAIRPPELQ
jgi:hypothetical protein